MIANEPLCDNCGHYPAYHTSPVRKFHWGKIISQCRAFVRAPLDGICRCPGFKEKIEINVTTAAQPWGWQRKDLQG